MKEKQMRPRRALPGSIAAGADDLSVAFEGLANPTRLAVVQLLATNPELRVTELAEACHTSQPRMSWHLRILRQARVVATRRDGREVFCRLDRAAIAAHMRRFVELLAEPEGGPVIAALRPLTAVPVTAPAVPAIVAGRSHRNPQNVSQAGHRTSKKEESQ